MNSKHSPLRRSSLAAVLVVGSVTAAHAQFRASIEGTVTDSTGAVIPNATLTLRNQATNQTTQHTSNESGVYNFSALSSDLFTLTVEGAGFKKQVISDIRVTPDQANAINVKMELGGTDTTVNVSADAVQNIETATANISGTVDSNQIEHLPSAGRDVFQLVQLAPGVFGDGAQSASGTGSQNTPGSQGPGASTRASGIFSTENGPQANSNGGQYETNSIAIDGISTVSAVWGGTSIITPSEDSVGSVKVVSNDYDAEQGRFSGAQVQVTSKSGSNQYHGSLFFRANRPGLNAYQRYNGAASLRPGTLSDRGVQRDATRSNQFGGSVGGPILHDRLFAFFAYETQRDSSSQPGTAWYETAAFRALAPAGSIANTFLNFPGAAVSATGIVNATCADVALRENINCVTIPGQGLNLGSPLKSARGTQDLTWQSVNNPGVGGGLTGTADIAQYNTVNPTTQIGAQYNGRLDADVTKKDHLAVAIYWVPLSKTNYNGPVRAYNLFHHNQTNDAYSLIYNHVFSSTLLNEARVNDAGWRWNEVTDNPQEPFGLPPAQLDNIGNITFTSPLFGAPGPSNFNQHTYTYKDVATKTAGNHIIKFGGEVNRLYYLNNPTYSARPNYNFYNIWDFLNDAPHSEAGSFNPANGTPTTNRQDEREDLYGFFVQDDWKARPNLTLNAGLRYSYFGPLSSKQNNIGVLQFGTGSTTYTGLSVRKGGNLTQAQKGNFGPEFGFAFTPDRLNGKAVLRGGYGLNYNQTEIAITGNSGSNPPYVLNAGFNNSSIKNGVANIDPRIVYAVASDSKSLFGYPANPNAVGGFNAANLPISGGAFITGYQQTQPTIYTQHYSLESQFDLGHNLVATAGYQGSVTHHLIVQTYPYVQAFAAGIAQNPLVSTIDYYGNTGHSNNNSLLLGFKHQMSHGFMFDAEFNYAKTMDTGSGPYYVDPYPYRPDLAYGRSDFNYGKAFKLYGLWQPRFYHGSNYFAHLASDGWSVSGIFNLHSGFPFTALYNTGNNVFFANSPTNTLRPAAYNGGAGKVRSNDAFENGKANLNFPANSTITNGASPYFVNPNTGIPTTGNVYTLPSLPGVARNSFDGPGYRDVDMTITKKFVLPKLRVIGEDGGLEFRADAFNVFNNINLVPGSVDTNILDATFGQANQGLAGRIVNLQARFSF